jgi:flagellar biosynthesis protein FliP
MIDIRWIIIPLFIISILYWAVVNVFQSPFALPMLVIVGLLIYLYVKNSLAESVRQEEAEQEAQQNQVRYREIIQSFKGNTEKYLCKQLYVLEVQRSISGIIDPQERRERAKDIREHLRYNLPRFKDRHLFKAGAEDVLKTCFEAMHPQETSESCKTRAEEAFKKIMEI